MAPNSDAPIVIRYTGDETFIATTAGGHSLAIDTKGDRKSTPGPLELFIIGLGTCTSTDVISILQKKRVDVTGYRVEIRTRRREEHPRRFERIELKHIVRGHSVPPEAVARAISLSTDKYCSAIATVRATAEIVTSFEIEDEAAVPPAA